MPTYAFALVSAEPGSTGNKPYTLYRYAKIKDARAACAAKEDVVVYSGPARLAQILSMDEVIGIWKTVNPERCNALEGVDILTACASLHIHMVENIMVDCSNGEMAEKKRFRTHVRIEKDRILKSDPDYNKEEEPEKSKEEVYSTVKQLMAHKGGPLKKSYLALNILPLIFEKDLTLKQGTNRHRNVLIVMRAKTVGAALEKLEKQSPKGSYSDIKFCLNRGFISLGESDD